MGTRRSYRMGKRQEAVDATKRRIMAAAAAEYSDHGIEATSMTSVARRADVAPGTVLYHYPTPHRLAAAVVEGWLDELDAPAVDSIPADGSLQERVRVLVRELFGLFERSERQYQVYRQSPDHPVLARYERWWADNVQAMIERALGEHADDVESSTVVGALVDPGFRGILLGRGLSAEQAIEVAAALVIRWLDEGAD